MDLGLFVIKKIGLIALLLCGVTLAPGSSYASTITFPFNSAPGGSPYIESGFSFDVARIDNGNCDSPSGKSCLALNTNETSTLTKVGGGTFTLNSFGFELLGNPATLTITDNLGDKLVFTQNDSHPCATPFCKNVWYTAFPFWAGITSVIFDDTGTGNIRIDDINVVANAASPPPAVTPLPGAVSLFVSGLGTLGMLGWRRKRKKASAAAT